MRAQTLDSPDYPKVEVHHGQPATNGEYAKALGFARMALTLVPNDANKQQVQSIIGKLPAAKDIN